MHTLMIPGDPTEWYVSPDSEGSLKGFVAGMRFFDRLGRMFRLIQIASDLTNNAFAAGEACVYKAAVDRIVTNDVSDGADTTNPIAGGVVMGAIGEAGSDTATDSTARYALILVDGYHSAVVTDGGGDIAAFDLIVADETVDGAVDKFAYSTIDDDQAEKVAQSAMGWATAADSATHVAAYVKVKT